MKLPITLDGFGFAKSFASRKAKRHVEKLFGGIGLENIKWVVQNDKDLALFIPPEQLAQYRQGVYLAEGWLKIFTEADLLSWVPLDYFTVINSLPNGPKWITRQLRFIRNFISNPTT